MRRCECLEKTCKNVSNQTYLPVVQNRARASQKGSKAQRTLWTGAHPRRGLRMSRTGLQTQWGVSEYLKMAAQSQTYLIQLCAEPCVGEPKRLETQTDTSDACTHVQRAAKDSRKPTDKPECVRIPQNGCIKPNSPGRSPKPSPEKAQRPREDVDALSGRMNVHSARIDMVTTAKIAEVISTPPK